MTAPALNPYLLWLVLDDELTILNRAVSLLRRHRLTLGGLATMPGPEPRLMTLTAMVRTEPAPLDVALGQLRKIVGVRAGAAISLVQPSVTQETVQ